MTTVPRGRRARLPRLPAADEPVYVALVVVAFVENAVRRHEHASQDFDALGASRFTIPVSVIVAAYNEETAIESTVDRSSGSTIRSSR